MIPVPVKQQPNTPYPLNVEDTDIPYIEDENGRQTHGEYSFYFIRFPYTLLLLNCIVMTLKASQILLTIIVQKIRVCSSFLIDLIDFILVLR